MRIALGVEYHGAAFCGWQTQTSGCGAQDHLEKALAAFVGAPVSTICAGRTDTGVHALAQVVHLDTEVGREAHAWVRGTNAFLPKTLRVLWAKQVADDFNARFSALTRTYQYLLLNDPVEPGVLDGVIASFHQPLSLERMREAAKMMVGEHDFSAFRASECQANSPMRVMHKLDITRAEQLIRFTFCANAFLHHMVRNIVGELVYVGAGRHTIEEFSDIFHSRDRTKAAPTFAAEGLYLTHVEYEAKYGLPLFRARHPFFAHQS
jgi:tRNA pseudouridine38-40 synthase